MLMGRTGKMPMLRDNIFLQNIANLLLRDFQKLNSSFCGMGIPSRSLPSNEVKGSIQHDIIMMLSKHLTQQATHAPAINLIPAQISHQSVTFAPRSS